LNLSPLLNASLPIQIHAFAAMSAFVLGLVQFARAKGTFSHRTFGWIWVCLMVIVAASSFWIHHINLWGPWSPIHLLSVMVLALLPYGIWRARNHRVRGHAITMICIFIGGLIIAGIFTFVPGRIMYDVLLGG
jgi:uncharacterized membrane protein